MSIEKSRFTSRFLSLQASCKVESAVGHGKKTPLKGQRFESLEQAQAYLDRWEANWADTRIHGTTKRQVATMFAEEKPTLLPLPVEPFRYYQYGERVVHLDGCVEVEVAYYGLPPGWIGRGVKVQGPPPANSVPWVPMRPRRMASLTASFSWLRSTCPLRSRSTMVLSDASRGSRAFPELRWCRGVPGEVLGSPESCCSDETFSARSCAASKA